MSWIRAVWLEGEKEEEGTIPDLWIEQDSVLWPPVANGLRFLKERKNPTEKWKKFPLVKIKKKSGKDSSCRNASLRILEIFINSYNLFFKQNIFLNSYCML